jgi:hypothetical protein
LPSTLSECPTLDMLACNIAAAYLYQLWGQKGIVGQEGEAWTTSYTAGGHWKRQDTEETPHKGDSRSSEIDDR